MRIVDRHHAEFRTQFPGKRKCCRCGEIKGLLEFYPKKQDKYGVGSRCRKCSKLESLAWMRTHLVTALIMRARARAKRERVAFDIRTSDILPLPTHCPIFGIPLHYGKCRQDLGAYSLDRVDNCRGYVRGNVAVISSRANRIKNDGTAKEHQQIADWMRRQGVK
jgi:hypothetical protein